MNNTTDIKSMLKLKPDYPWEENLKQVEMQQNAQRTTGIASVIGGLIGALASGGSPFGWGIGSAIGNIVGQRVLSEKYGTDISPLRAIITGIGSGFGANYGNVGGGLAGAFIPTQLATYKQIQNRPMTILDALKRMKYGRRI